MYNQFVNAFIDAQTQSVRLYREMAKSENALFGEHHAHRAVCVPTAHEIEAELRPVYETVITRIIAAAGIARPGLNRVAICREAGIDVERALATGVVPDFDGLSKSLRGPRGGDR